MFKVLTRELIRGERPVFALIQSVGSQVIVLVLNVVTGAITARLLGADGRGTFAAVTIWPQLLASLSLSGIGSGLVYFMRRSDGTERSAYVSTTFTVAVITVSVTVLPTMLFLPILLDKYGSYYIILAQICLTSTYINAAQMLMRQSFVGYASYKQNSISSVVAPLFYLGTLILIASITHFNATLAVLALVASSFISIIVQIPVFFRLWKRDCSCTATTSAASVP